MECKHLLVLMVHLLNQRVFLLSVSRILYFVHYAKLAKFLSRLFFRNIIFRCKKQSQNKILHKAGGGTNIRSKSNIKWYICYIIATQPYSTLNYVLAKFNFYYSTSQEKKHTNSFLFRFFLFKQVPFQYLSAKNI